MSEENDAKETGSSEEPKAKRRWYQYSLRSLVIVMVLLCFLFAWVGVKIRQAEKQKEIVAWVRKNGGGVGYDYEYDANGYYLPDAKPPGPDWLREWIGIHYFCNIQAVMFRGGINDSELTPLQGLPFLESIGFFVEFGTNQEFQKLQSEFPNCEIIRRKLGQWQVWCKQCNDWHRIGANQHTAYE